VITHSMPDIAETQLCCLSLTDLSQVHRLIARVLFAVAMLKRRCACQVISQLRSARALAVVACTSKLFRAASDLAFRCVITDCSAPALELWSVAQCIQTHLVSISSLLFLQGPMHQHTKKPNLQQCMQLS